MGQTHQYPLVLLERDRKMSHLLFHGIGLVNLPECLCNIQTKKKEDIKGRLTFPFIFDLPLLFIGKRKELGRKECRKRTKFLLFFTVIGTIVPYKHALHSVVQYFVLFAIFFASYTISGPSITIFLNILQ